MFSSTKLRNSNKVLLTAIAGEKDDVVNNQCHEGAVPIAYLDALSNPSGFRETESWWIRSIKSGKLLSQREDYVRTAKQFKILPHVYLPKIPDITDKIEYSLWIDGNVRLKVPMQVLIDKYLKDTDIAFFKHPLRDCIYQEADTCRRLILDDVFTMELQMRDYKKEGYPEHNGLIDGSIILRRHTPQIEKLNDAWWRQIVKYSRRDQLSFNYVAWKLGIKYTIMDGFNHVYSNEYFESTSHKRERN